MIGYLSGTILEAHTNPLILLVQGVGYAINIPESYSHSLSAGDTLSLYIHTHVREDAIVLFGFRHKEELHLFMQLISVSGIGPKIAIAIMAKGADAVQNAIVSEDSAFFSSIPRLGSKNAQKIIIELKNKLPVSSFVPSNVLSHAAVKDVVAALSSMGFSQKEIQKALSEIPPTNNQQDLLKEVLKHLA